MNILRERRAGKSSKQAEAPCSGGFNADYAGRRTRLEDRVLLDQETYIAAPEASPRGKRCGDHAGVPNHVVGRVPGINYGKQIEECRDRGHPDHQQEHQLPPPRLPDLSS